MPKGIYLHKSLSEIHKKALSKSITGKKRSVDTKIKMSEAHIAEKAYNYKGDDACYTSKHKRIYTKYGSPTVCENCGKNGLIGRKIHWANISKKYKNVRSDWLRLCVSCHKLYDLGKLKIIK